MIKKIVMCPPEYYQIEYEINPWMDVENKVDKQNAYQQYAKLKSIYESLGYQVDEISPVEGLPDMVYINNNGHAQGNVFIRGAMKYQERQGETDYVEEYFAKQNYKLVRLSDNCIFEGQGDLLRTKNKYFYGWGKRSNIDAKHEIEEALGAELIDLELVDPYHYHLNMCLCPIDDTCVLISKSSFTDEGLEKIYNNVQNVIEVNEVDNKAMLCNALMLGDKLVATQGLSQSTKDQLTAYGVSVIETEMTEFLKGGGSIKCLSMLVFE